MLIGLICVDLRTLRTSTYFITRWNWYNTFANALLWHINIDYFYTFQAYITPIKLIECVFFSVENVQKANSIYINKCKWSINARQLSESELKMSRNERPYKIMLDSMSWCIKLILIIEFPIVFSDQLKQLNNLAVFLFVLIFIL